MLLEFIVMFIFGLILLVKGSDYFVESAAKIASILGISPFIIGLTIVAIGTSLPEMAASIMAVLNGSPELAVGTVIGSNISNIALILGFSALFSSGLIVKKRVLEKDVFMMFMVSLLFFYFSVDGIISFSEGLIFLFGFFFYMIFLIGVAKKFSFLFDFDNYLNAFFGTKKFEVFNLQNYIEIMKAGINPATYKKILSLHTASFKKEFGEKIDTSEKKEAKEMYKEKLFASIAKESAVIIIAGAGIVFGAKILIDGAIGAALLIGIPESFVGLVFVAIGTSLPELGVSISSAKKGFHEILVGNIIGSNISNILLVIGSASLFAPVSFSVSAMFFPFLFMIAVTLILMVFIYQNLCIARFAGIILLFIYALFIYRINPF